MQHFQPGYDFPGLSQSASSWTAPYLAPTQDDFMNGEWNMQPHMEAPSPFPDQRMTVEFCVCYLTWGLTSIQRTVTSTPLSRL